jgi:hypothetical protein
VKGQGGGEYRRLDVGGQENLFGDQVL